MNTRIEYLYRDASNYKLRNEVILDGAIAEEDVRCCLWEGEYLLPTKLTSYAVAELKLSAFACFSTL